MYNKRISILFEIFEVLGKLIWKNHISIFFNPSISVFFPNFFKTWSDNQIWSKTNSIVWQNLPVISVLFIIVIDWSYESVAILKKKTLKTKH